MPSDVISHLGADGYVTILKLIDFHYKRFYSDKVIALTMRSPFQSTDLSIFIALAIVPVVTAEELNENILEEEKPYSLKLSVSPAGGYNSNVILLGDGLPLPSGISQQGAGFFEIGSTATFDWKSSAVAIASEAPLSKDQITATYEYKADFYEGISGFDPGVHAWGGKYTHLFDKQWRYRIESKDTYATIDGHSYSNKVSITPVLAFQAADDKNKIAKELTTELAFSFATSDFYFPPSIPARNMDANNYSVELSITFIPRDYDAAKFKLGFIHFENDADGTDYDYDRNRLQFNAETRFSTVTTNRWYDLKAIIKYFHDFDMYDHLNSHAGPMGFAFKRRDDKDDLGAGLTFDVLKYSDGTSKFAVNFQYHYLRDDSDVAFFNYTQHFVQVGCTLTFDQMKWR